MTAIKTDPVIFSFKSAAVAPETFEVTGFEGTEAISQPYSITIDLVADNPDIDMEKLLYNTATLRIEKGDDIRKMHGVVAECRLSDALPDHRIRYQVVLKPRIWLLSLSRQNQIYQDASVPEIIAQEIKASTAKGATKAAKAGLAGDDYESRLTRKYPNREYTVQYRESDLDFISRLMEHEGIFYFFEQGDDREKIILTDNNVHFASLAGNDTLVYSPESGLDRAENEAVLSFTYTSRRTPHKLVLKDYNYRLPHVMLQADANVDDDAHGLICEYADHFKTPEEGSELARIRAQELYCAKQTFEGRSDSIRLRPGWRFTLDEHFRQAFNNEYVVTAITHSGHQPVEGVSGLNQSGSAEASYGNKLICIPADVNYRPPRRTPKPVIPGLMNAHVDAALLEDRAEIDDQGRYKLIMPFDLSGAAAGKASRYVRKAQPYGGRDMGMHFPLHKGTEVICNFINGDPDRPIITGVVSNPLTASVVSAANSTKNVIKTASGAFMEFSDGAGKTAANSGGGGGGLGAQQQMQSVYLDSSQIALQPSQPVHESFKNLSSPSDDPMIGAEAQKRRLRLQQQLAANDTYKESDAAGSNDKWFRVKVPNYEGSKDSYLRLGASVPEEVIEQKGTSDDAIVMTYNVTPAQGAVLDDIRREIVVNCIEGNQVILNPAGVPNDPGSTPPAFTLGSNSGNAAIGATGQFKVTAPSIQTPLDTVIIAAIETKYSNCTVITRVSLNISRSGDLYPGGWFDFTSGDRTSITIGNKEEKVMSEEGWCTYEGIHKVGSVARKVTLEHTSAFSGAFGDEESYFGGTKIEGFLGFKNEVALASAFEAYTGFKYETHLDWNFQIGTQGTVNLINGPEYKWVDDHQTFGTEIKLHVVKKDLTPKAWTIIQVVAQLLGTGVVAGLAGAKGVLHRLDNAGTNIVGDVTEWSTHGAFALTHAIMLVWSLERRRKIKTMEASAKAVTQLNMTIKDVELRCGKGGLKIFEDGEVLVFGKKIAFAYDSPSGYHPGLTIDEQGIAIHKGDIEIQAGKLISESDIETKSGQIKSQTFTSPPAAPALPSDSVGKMKGKRKFGPVITKALKGLRKSGPFETI